MTNNLATVEALTAEVRVLMVGNRQVTLSVAKQLDEVDIEELTIFGRVRVKRHAGDGENWLIGAGPDGTLCIASWEPTERRPWVFLPAEAAKITVCRALRQPVSDRYVLRWKERELNVHPTYVEQCGVDGHWPYRPEGQCDGWNPNGTERWFDSAIENYELERAPHRAAAEAPLIVLAGLR